MEIKFMSYQIMGGSAAVAVATVALKKGDREIKEACIGNGPIDAVCNCIDRIAGQSGKFLKCETSILHGKIFTALLSAEINHDVFPGRGTSPDDLEAIARAYMDAHNRCSARMERAEWI